MTLMDRPGSVSITGNTETQGTGDHQHRRGRLEHDGIAVGYGISPPAVESTRSGLATINLGTISGGSGSARPTFGAVLFLGGSSSVRTYKYTPCPGCGKPKATASKTCGPCYHAARVRPMEERFWEKVEWSEGCWRWTGATAKGYGKFSVSKSLPPQIAPRVAYEMVVGTIPTGFVIDHLCRNPICVNPAHLEPVSPRLNVLRSPLEAGNRAFRTHCPHGHEYTPENTHVSTRNQRSCRTCIRQRNREYRQRVNLDRLAAA